MELSKKFPFFITKHLIIYQDENFVIRNPYFWICYFIFQNKCFITSNYRINMAS